MNLVECSRVSNQIEVRMGIQEEKVDNLIKVKKDSSRVEDILISMNHSMKKEKMKIKSNLISMSIDQKHQNSSQRRKELMLKRRLLIMSCLTFNLRWSLSCKFLWGKQLTRQEWSS